jgi:hypothetical protein
MPTGFVIIVVANTKTRGGRKDERLVFGGGDFISVTKGGIRGCRVSSKSVVRRRSDVQVGLCKMRG